MRYKIEKLVCYLLIIILLPYIVTVFLNGPTVVSSMNVEEALVKVQTNADESGEQDYIEISIEDYGIGVLAREISVSYEAEAIKSQAIIVRTRIYKEIEEKGSDGILEEEFFTQSDMEEAWKITKFADYYNKLKTAWEETEGKVLMYEGKLINAPFFSLSNGNTRDGKEVLGEEYSYLKIKDCPLDIEETEQIQTTTLSKAESELTNIEIESCDTAGYVMKVRIGEEVVNAEEFRQNYNLASSCFSIQEYEGQIRITTRGVGHGIGMSQNTANKMAEEGKSAVEILEYFYEGCEIKEVTDFVRNEKNVTFAENTK